MQRADAKKMETSWFSPSPGKEQNVRGLYQSKERGRQTLQKPPEV